MNPGRASCAGLSFGQLGESAGLDVADSVGATRLAAQVRLESSLCGFVANSVRAKRQGALLGPLSSGTRGGGRTHTSLTGHGILSPARLPIPPLWLFR